MRAKWRERVWTQYVSPHVLFSKSRFSTPEICAHDSVRIGRSVGTSGPKVNS